MTDRAPSYGPPDLPQVPMADPKAPKHWLVRPATIRLLWIVSCAILALFVGADFFVHGHAYFGLDGTFGFYAWFGFFTCVAMVVGAKVLGIFLKRKDSYYD
jgi:hypothetical protein